LYVSEIQNGTILVVTHSFKISHHPGDKFIHIEAQPSSIAGRLNRSAGHLRSTAAAPTIIRQVFVDFMHLPLQVLLLFLLL
jgi:hypothetical protein